MECAKVDCGRRKESIDVACSGFCNRRYHRKCVQLSEYDSELIIKNACINYVCIDCLGKFAIIKEHYQVVLDGIGKIDESLKLMEKKLDDNNVVVNKKLSDTIMKFEDGVTERIIKYIDSNNAVISNMIGHKIDDCVKQLNDVVKGHAMPYAENHVGKNKDKVSFADILKLPVYITPKENLKNQVSAVTKEEVKKAIQPANLSVEINNIRELRNNDGVIINCLNKDSVNKIQAELEQKIGNDYVINTPKLKNPNILIVGMSDNITKESVVKAIKAQNNFACTEIQCHKVYESFKKKGSCNAIIEVDGEAYKNIMSIGKLNIEWDRCVVYEHSRVLRCLKCLGYNHNAKNCKAGACCYKCGENDHIATQCKLDVIVCLNCKRAKTNLGLTDIDICHETKSVTCPVYLRKLKQLKNRTIY